MIIRLRLFLLVLLCLSIVGCASHRGDGLPGDYNSFDASKIPDATPKVEAKSKYGNPSSYVVLGKRYQVLNNSACYHDKGIASWYGTMFHERKTSSGEPYNMYKMTAANKVLPLPTYVRVHNLENGRTVIVKVNDRGPFHVNRIIDLSFAAAKKIGMLGKGTALVEITAIDPSHPNQLCPGEIPVGKKPAVKPQLYVQLGAYSVKASADQLANRLTKFSNRPIVVYQSVNAQHNLYKVQIGPLASVDEADQLTAELKQHGFGQAYAMVR